MQAWRVHRHGEPGEVFELDEIPEPTAADLEGLGMHMSGWVPVQPGIEPFDDWVIMRMSVAALALPDVTMARGLVSGAGGDAVRVGTRRRRRRDRSSARAAGPARQARRGGVHPAVRQPRAGRRSASRPCSRCPTRCPTRTPRGVHDPGAHRVARGAPTRAGPRGRDGRGDGRGRGTRRRDRAAVRRRRMRRVRRRRWRREGGGGRRTRRATPSTTRPATSVEALRAATGGHGVDVIVDPVQGEIGARVRDLLVPDGRHVLVRPCRRTDRARSALLRAQPHARRRHARRLPAGRDGPHPRRDPDRDRGADGRRSLPAAGQPRASTSPTCPRPSPTWRIGAPGVESSSGSDRPVRWWRGADGARAPRPRAIRTWSGR